jgi:Cof subfamily protein (haloacid dehalogenase superfamily)
VQTRPAALAVLETVGLAGEGGVLSDSTPGVFLQGLQVYGNGGSLLHSERLDPFVVTETFEFSVEHQSPLVGFSADRCVTLFSHTLVDALHDIYYEPKAEVLECIDQINKVRIQKVLFYDTAERVASFLRPHWTLAVNGRATVVQALPEMMEILPAGASKGTGVQRLLDHLGVPIDQVMAIGDGENDIEMLAMVGWGVAMANGTERTKSVAQAVTSSNDEDGVAKAIQDYIL